MNSVGVRLDEEMLERLKELSDEEETDRSTVIRRLVKEGYQKHMAEKAASMYRKGEVTLSEAADIAGKTVWEMENYLVENGYVSDYSLKDLERETENLTD